MVAHPKFSQQRFDHMRSLIRKVKDRALVQHDPKAEAEAELLNALLLMFVEPLIVEDSIIVQESKI
jgi:hypothetical protein